MKAFLYSTLSGASGDSDCFDSVMRGRWASPSLVVSGDSLGSYWLPYSPLLVGYCSEGVLTDLAFEELYVDGEVVPPEDLPEYN